MTTTCETCGARLLARTHVHRSGDPLLFVETYACGAARAWGMLEVDVLWLRQCTAAGGAQ